MARIKRHFNGSMLVFRLIKNTLQRESSAFPFFCSSSSLSSDISLRNFRVLLLLFSSTSDQRSKEGEIKKLIRARHFIKGIPIIRLPRCTNSGASVSLVISFGTTNQRNYYYHLSSFRAEVEYRGAFECNYGLLKCH